jgi:hypothetical protein
MGRRQKRIAIPVSKAKMPRAYRALWRVVDGAVADAFNQHPDYLTEKGRRSARRSIVKRATGALYGFACEAASQHAKRRSAPDRAAAQHATGASQTPEAASRLFNLFGWARRLLIGRRAPHHDNQRG